MINLRTRDGWQQLKDILDDRPDDVLRICGLAPPRRATVTIDDPAGSGRENFAIWLRADGLSWKCFTNDKKGRSLELIAYCHGWYDLPKRGADEAARYVIAQLGLGKVDSAQLEADRKAAAERQARARSDADADLARRRRAAFASFVNAKPILGSRADTYLASRGIHLMDPVFVGPRGGSLAPACLRSIDDMRHIDDRGRATSWPCMIACCVDADMRIAATHRTWLARDGLGKAPVKPARKVFPDSAGCVIPLWNGQGNYPVRVAIENGLLQTLVLTEGVEDGLSAVLAAPKHRVWAMISLSNMVNVAARLPACCDSVIVHQQNDWEKPAAIEAFERGLTALRATGRVVAIVGAIDGKDLNDTLRGAA